MNLYVICIVLSLLQFAAALPWVVLLNIDIIRANRGKSGAWAGWIGGFIVVVVGAGLVMAYLMRLGPVQETLQLYGGLYAFILNVQLAIDFFIVTFAVLLTVWSKGAAVGLAAFREGWRQPMFWLILVSALLFMLITPYLPYFTFGEDYKMVTELGYDFIMLSGALFGVLAASMSISEEIEGRTAVTLMSKPVSRRQFLIGKFVGILMAALLMATILSFAFYGNLLQKLDRDSVPVPAGLDQLTGEWETRFGSIPAYFVRGIAFWIGHVLNLSPGIILGCCQVMVLLAIAVALATRLPMIVNLVICLVVFFLGHLTPVLQQVSQNRFTLVRFIADLFSIGLPGLDLFNIGPAIARDAPPPLWPFMGYVGAVSLYAVLYTSIALLIGLILFEDRDLA